MGNAAYAFPCLKLHVAHWEVRLWRFFQQRNQCDLAQRFRSRFDHGMFLVLAGGPSNVPRTPALAALSLPPRLSQNSGED